MSAEQMIAELPKVKADEWRTVRRKRSEVAEAPQEACFIARALAFTANC